VYLRHLFVWDVSRGGLVVGADVSGQPVGPLFKGQEVELSHL
jgi:hypothetical protein